MVYDMYSPPTVPQRDVGRTPRDFRITHDRDGEARLSTTLVHAVADVLHIDVTEPERLLAEEINLGSLDTLFPINVHGSADASGHVAFTVGNTAITVYCDGTLVVTPAA